MLKKSIALLLISVMVAADLSAAQGPSPAVLVRKGTALKLSNLTRLDSAATKVGDDVPLRLERPLVIDGVTLLDSGELMHGRVTKVQRAGPHRKNGEVKWQIENISFHDDSKARSKVWFAEARFNGVVPERYYDREKDPGGCCDLTNKEAVGLIAVYPLFLLWAAISELKGRYAEAHDPMVGSEYVLPAGSTVAVVTTHDHEVR